jgi:hypothetical protein
MLSKSCGAIPLRGARVDARPSRFPKICAHFPAFAADPSVPFVARIVVVVKCQILFSVAEISQPKPSQPANNGALNS